MDFMTRKNERSGRQPDRRPAKDTRQRPREIVTPDRYATAAFQLNNLIEKDEGASVIGITSAEHNEGKTESVVMLGFAFASIFEYRVLIIDGDFRFSGLHQHFQIGKAPGLTDLLSNRVSFENAISRTSIEKLYVIPSGTTVSNPLSILVSKRLKSLIRHLSSQFDVILFDTPPVLGYQDISLLSPLLDGVAVIAKAGQSTLPKLGSALSALNVASVNVLGIILTDVERKR
jgi:capsular exopolysaccharide synthesis family protein